MAAENNSGELTGTERDEQAAARPHAMAQRLGQAVGERPIERDRQADVAVLVRTVGHRNVQDNRGARGSGRYDEIDVRLEAGYAPPIQSPHAGMGAGIAAPDRAAVAGAGGNRGGPGIAGIRSGMLSLPGKSAGGRRAQSPVHVDVRLRQRLCGAQAEYPRRALRTRRSADRGGRAGNLPGGVLLAETQPDDREYGARRSAEGRRRLGGAVS